MKIRNEMSKADESETVMREKEENRVENFHSAVLFHGNSLL